MQPIREELHSVKQDIQDMKQDIQNLKQDMQEVKRDIQDLKTRVKKIEATQENEILPRLNTIEACYTSTYERYKNSEKLQKIG